jgi:hypothetical protein
MFVIFHAGEWTQTIGENPENFLIYDNGRDSISRIVIFASPRALSKLCQADTWYMDGNFSLAPTHFAQLYIIRIPLGNAGGAVTVVYAILQRKDSFTYKEFLQVSFIKCVSYFVIYIYIYICVCVCNNIQKYP